MLAASANVTGFVLAELLIGFMLFASVRFRTFSLPLLVAVVVLPLLLLLAVVLPMV